MTAINLWALPNSGPDSLTMLQACLKGFARRYPKTQVHVSIKTTASMWDSLFLLLKRPDRFGPNGLARPDVIQFPSYWTSTLARWGLVEEMNSFEPPVADNFIEGLSAHCGMEGSPKTFSLPWWMELSVLFYRKDVFKRIDLKEPPFASWDEFEEGCRRIARSPFCREGRHQVLENPNVRESISVADVAPFVWSRGGDFFSPDGSRSFLHRRETIDAMKAYVDWLRDGWMPLLGKRGKTRVDFFGGGCAMAFSGRFPRRYFSGRRGSAIGVQLAVEGGSSLLGAQHLAIARGSDHPVQAFELIKFLISRSSADQYAEAIGAFRCGRDWDADAFRTAPAIGAVFRAALTKARMLPNHVLMPTLERIFGRNMDRIVRSILVGEYDDESLKGELLYSGAETDYVIETIRPAANSNETSRVSLPVP